MVSSAAPDLQVVGPPAARRVGEVTELEARERAPDLFAIYVGDRGGVRRAMKHSDLGILGCRPGRGERDEGRAGDDECRQAGAVGWLGHVFLLRFPVQAGTGDLRLADGVL